MAVDYTVVERVDPRDLAVPRKYYAQIVNNGEVSFDELALYISRMSNLNYGMVLGTLATLMEVIKLHLGNGRPIRLDYLGTLFMTLKSEGSSDKQSFQTKLIKGANIRFRPGKELKELAGNLEFRKKD